MNIVPQSVVKIYKGIGWDSSYRHVRAFSSPSSRDTYLSSKLVKNVEGCVYARENGYLSVPDNASVYQNCNYVSFVNAGFNNKVFYCFVTRVEYVNTECTRLYIDTDYYQTWLFDIQYGACFVTREHVNDDAVGKHTIPEKLPIGDLVVKNVSTVNFPPIGVCAYAPSSMTFKTDFVNGIYNPLVNTVSATASELNSVLVSVADTPERIAMLRMGYQETDGTNASATRSNSSTFTWGDDSYQPVNNKMYCYPYWSLTLDDYGSNIEQYKWEDFADPMNAVFTVQNYATPYPISVVTPNNYKGMLDATQYMVVKTDFPDVPYVIDNFRAWMSSVGAKQQLSENNAIVHSVLGDISGAVGLLTGGAGGAGSAISSAAGATTGYIGRRADLETQKQSNAIDKEYAKAHGTSVGSQYGGNVAPWINGKRGWRLTQMTIKPEYARVIDNYFSRFGYEVDRYKVPNTTGRATFNYVKTVDANVGGDIPDECMVMIENMLNSGVTFWHTNNMLVYSNNPIV